MFALEKAMMNPTNRPFNVMHVFVHPLALLKEWGFCRQGKTGKCFQSCLIVFFHTVYWAVTYILQLMGIINTLCSKKKGDARLSVINIHAAFQENYMLCIYVKAPGSTTMFLITVCDSFQLLGV